MDDWLESSSCPIPAALHQNNSKERCAHRRAEWEDLYLKYENSSEKGSVSFAMILEGRNGDPPCEEETKSISKWWLPLQKAKKHRHKRKLGGRKSKQARTKAMDGLLRRKAARVQNWVNSLDPDLFEENVSNGENEPAFESNENKDTANNEEDSHCSDASTSVHTVSDLQTKIHKINVSDIYADLEGKDGTFPTIDVTCTKSSGDASAGREINSEWLNPAKQCKKADAPLLLENPMCGVASPEISLEEPPVVFALPAISQSVKNVETIEIDLDDESPIEIKISPPPGSARIERCFLDKFNVEYFKQLGMEWKPDVNALRKVIEEETNRTSNINSNDKHQNHCGNQSGDNGEIQATTSCSSLRLSRTTKNKSKRVLRSEDKAPEIPVQLVDQSLSDVELNSKPCLRSKTRMSSIIMQIEHNSTSPVRESTPQCNKCVRSENTSKRILSSCSKTEVVSDRDLKACRTVVTGNSQQLTKSPSKSTTPINNLHTSEPASNQTRTNCSNSVPDDVVCAPNRPRRNTRSLVTNNAQFMKQPVPILSLNSIPDQLMKTETTVSVNTSFLKADATTDSLTPGTKTGQCMSSVDLENHQNFSTAGKKCDSLAVNQTAGKKCDSLAVNQTIPGRGKRKTRAETKDLSNPPRKDNVSLSSSDEQGTCSTGEPITQPMVVIDRDEVTRFSHECQGLVINPINFEECQLKELVVEVVDCNGNDISHISSSDCDVNDMPLLPPAEVAVSFKTSQSKIHGENSKKDSHFPLPIDTRHASEVAADSVATRKRILPQSHDLVSSSTNYTLKGSGKQTRTKRVSTCQGVNLSPLKSLPGDSLGRNDMLVDVPVVDLEIVSDADDVQIIANNVKAISESSGEPNVFSSGPLHSHTNKLRTFNKDQGIMEITMNSASLFQESYPSKNQQSVKTVSPQKRFSFLEADHKNGTKTVKVSIIDTNVDQYSKTSNTNKTESKDEDLVTLADRGGGNLIIVDDSNSCSDDEFNNKVRLRRRKSHSNLKSSRVGLYKTRGAVTNYRNSSITILNAKQFPLHDNAKLNLRRKSSLPLPEESPKSHSPYASNSVGSKTDENSSSSVKKSYILERLKWRYYSDKSGKSNPRNSSKVPVGSDIHPSDDNSGDNNPCLNITSVGVVSKNSSSCIKSSKKKKKPSGVTKAVQRETQKQITNTPKHCPNTTFRGKRNAPVYLDFLDISPSCSDSESLIVQDNISLAAIQEKITVEKSSVTGEISTKRGKLVQGHNASPSNQKKCRRLSAETIDLTHHKSNGRQLLKDDSRRLTPGTTILNASRKKCVAAKYCSINIQEKSSDNHTKEQSSRKKSLEIVPSSLSSSPIKSEQSLGICKPKKKMTLDNKSNLYIVTESEDDEDNIFNCRKPKKIHSRVVTLTNKNRNKFSSQELHVRSSESSDIFDQHDDYKKHKMYGVANLNKTNVEDRLLASSGRIIRDNSKCVNSSLIQDRFDMIAPALTVIDLAHSSADDIVNGTCNVRTKVKEHVQTNHESRPGLVEELFHKHVSRKRQSDKISHKYDIDEEICTDIEKSKRRSIQGSNLFSTYYPDEKNFELDDWFRQITRGLMNKDSILDKNCLRKKQCTLRTKGETTTSAFRSSVSEDRDCGAKSKTMSESITILSSDSEVEDMF